MRAEGELHLRIVPIDLEATLGCGQTFRWERLPDGSWRGIVGRDVVALRESGDGVLVRSASGDRGAGPAIERYLRASDDIPKIHDALEADPIISKGIRRMRGLRLVKMDEWECLVSYALATYANIPRIKKMIDALASSFGERVHGDIFSFPTIQQLDEATVGQLATCGLGYRARYVRGICDAVDENDIELMKQLSTPDLRARLQELPGVGDKVADCVSLFGFGRLEAFPIDVWVRRALQRLYGVDGSYATLARFARERFGEYAGYAQEYLFHNERALMPGGGCAFSDQADD